ncbi:chorismate binding enzyme family protein [Mycobacterium xenopi 4042]|uniref:Chorismate binding enzyme family protein n=1 Tax=Mycobacterium xenopi 4042 TaxID=1299334 RepID=X8AEN7_MYCXE|nr:chorismate binding enzyme family protein [Mycobacterium xenopi 4042]
MRIERLGDLGGAPQVLRAVGDAASRLGLPPPAALIGDWFGAQAVIAPSVSAQPADPDEAFAVRPGCDTTAVGGGWIGYLSYPDPGRDGAPGRLARAAGAGPIACCAATGAASGGMRACPVPACRIGWRARSRRRHRCMLGASTGPSPTARNTAPGCWPAWRPSLQGRCIRRACARSSAGSSRDAAGLLCRRGRGHRSGSGGLCGRTVGAVASLSPELFLRRCGDVVTSSPIKGTLPLQASPSALRTSVKDVAENIMIVDLVRNDLGRVAVTGTVTVPELLAVQRAPGVWHLVSTVSARVPVDLPASALLDAVFPPRR